MNALWWIEITCREPTPSPRNTDRFPFAIRHISYTIDLFRDDVSRLMLDSWGLLVLSTGQSCGFPRPGFAVGDDSLLPR